MKGEAERKAAKKLVKTRVVRPGFDQVETGNVKEEERKKKEGKEENFKNLVKGFKIHCTALEGLGREDSAVGSLGSSSYVGSVRPMLYNIEAVTEHCEGSLREMHSTGGSSVLRTLRRLRQ